MVWSDNHHNKCDIPETDADCIAIAADKPHLLGLETGDSIVTGDLDDYTPADYYYTLDGSLDFKDTTAGSDISIYYGGFSNSPKLDAD